MKKGGHLAAFYFQRRVLTPPDWVNFPPPYPPGHQTYAIAAPASFLNDNRR